MNSNPRGVQTPPRPQPPRNVPNTGASHPSEHPFASVSKGFWITLVVTMILLASMLVTMTVVLCMADEPRVPANEPSGGGQTQNDKKQDNTPITPTRTVKTGISLPSATKAGTYAYATASATDISGDSGLVSAAAALVDVTNGKAVATKNGSTKIYPASMTKVMTLLVACENATDPTALLTVTDEMVAKYASTDGASVAMNWQVGYQVTVEDALYMVIYESDTYACWLLAEHIAGSEAAFVQKMNQRASSLGLTGTHFENSTGLFHSNHYTTCFDMAAIMAAAMNNEAAVKVLTAKQQYTVDIYIGGTKNSSLGVPMWSGWYTGRLEQYRYGAAAPKYAGNGSDIELIAGKTGYETIPMNCFVTAGKNVETGTLFVCVQVGRIEDSDASVNAKTSTDDTREIYQRYATY